MSEPSPFSPDYVSQIKPFKMKKARRPLIDQPPTRDSINTSSAQQQKAKSWKLLKTTI